MMILGQGSWGLLGTQAATLSGARNDPQEVLMGIMGAIVSYFQGVAFSYDVLCQLVFHCGSGVGGGGSGRG